MAKRARKTPVGSAGPTAKSTQGHGGPRDGAGRKPRLNENQQVWTGAYYHQCWVKLIRGLARLRQQSDAVKRAISEEGEAGKNALSEIRDHHRLLNKLPLGERRGPRAGWVRNWRERVGDLIKITGGRYVSYAPYIKRAKGFRTALLRTVALKASKRFDAKVSPRMVERAMKAHRAERAEIRAHLEFGPK
jgi:hypothetical protein